MKLSSSSPSSLTPTIVLILFYLAFTEAQDSSRPFGGGNFGYQAGFPGLQPYFVSKTCNAQWECPLREGKGDSRSRSIDESNSTATEGETGIFVCRQTYHPIFGTLQTRAKCISPDEAYETDECGCCDGEDCPVVPTFQNITCDNLSTVKDFQDGSTNAIAVDGVTRRWFGRVGGNPQLSNNAVVVCRRHYNPYTGILEPMSMYIDPTKSLATDMCGCCNGICPHDLDDEGLVPRFARPDHVELSWCDATSDFSNHARRPCILPHAQNYNDDSNDNAEGVFVCRSMANMLTGVAESQTLCVSPNRAWETDQCGCCGEDCPEQTGHVDLECNIGVNDGTATTQECQFFNGDTGFFACRSLFHPMDGSVIQRTLCLKHDEDDGENAWVTDFCGCCGDECPAIPEGGFPRVDLQMMQLTLEDESIGTILGGTNPDLGGELYAEEQALAENANSKIGLGMLFLGCIAVAISLVRRYAKYADDSTLPKYDR